MKDVQIQKMLDQKQSIHELQLVISVMGKQLEKAKEEIQELKKKLDAVYPIVHENLNHEKDVIGDYELY